MASIEKKIKFKRIIASNDSESKLITVTVHLVTSEDGVIKTATVYPPSNVSLFGLKTIILRDSQFSKIFNSMGITAEGQFSLGQSEEVDEKSEIMRIHTQTVERIDDGDVFYAFPIQTWTDLLDYGKDKRLSIDEASNIPLWTMKSHKSVNTFVVCDTCVIRRILDDKMDLPAKYMKDDVLLVINRTVQTS